jgi:predicted Zn-dependent protease
MEASAEAYTGHLQKSRELSRQAVASWQQSGRKETAASDLMAATRREAAFGNLQEARKSALAALNKPIVGQDAKAFAALVFASVNDTTHAESLLDNLAKQFPEDTLMKFVVLPTVQARIELSRNNPARSIELLQASVPYELSEKALGGCLYPAYVRGQSYLALQNGSAAQVEFEKILNHRGIIRTCETGPLARVGLARAYVLQGNSSKAKATYQDFLTLWKDADPDIPVLKEAKLDYAKLGQVAP